MDNWLKKINYDPLSPLIESGKKAIGYFTGKDLKGKTDSLKEELDWFNKNQKIVLI